MATPLLIDTDMAIDDAVAVALALASEEIDLRAVVGVGGCVDVSQATRNIARLLAALDPPVMPKIGEGLNPPGDVTGRTRQFGEDGFGDSALKAPDGFEPGVFVDVYRGAIESAPGELAVATVGPLTNLARVLDELPELSRKIARVYVCGGAVWTQGDVTPKAEFNFHGDPAAARRVMSAGLNVTVAPLDLTRLVCIDESHVAHMAASGYRTGQVLAELLREMLNRESPPGLGKTFIHDAPLIGSIVWPDLFLRTRMRLEIETEGAERGRSKAALGGSAAEQLTLLTAVNAVDFLENLLECLCHEAFVV